MAIAHKAALRFLLAFLFVAASATACAAQSGTSTLASPLPKDPATLLALAAQRNGLHGPGLKPWHILASYQIYDAKGNPAEKGVFEEWWNSSTEYRISFNRPSYHLQIVVNPKGTFVSGNDVVPVPEDMVRHLYLQPVSTKLPGKGMKLDTSTKRLGKASLECIEEIPKGLHSSNQRDINPVFPTYCMEPNAPMLRVYGSYGQGWTEITGVASLEGRYLAEDATIFMNGKKYLTVHLDRGESANQWGASFFTAPPDAVPAAVTPFSILDRKTEDLMKTKIGGANPIYPFDAKEAHQSGTVLLTALIGTDGNIQSLVVTSAPAMSLAESALTAVKTWRYKPYLLHGHAVHIHIVITVIYSLN